MSKGFHRSLAWIIYITLLAGICLVPLSQLMRDRAATALENQSLGLEVRLAEKQGQELTALRARYDGMAGADGPNTAPFWPGSTAQDALLTMREDVSAILRSSGLVIDSVEGTRGGEDQLDLRVRARGDIAATQAALYAIETLTPRVAVARLRADVVPSNGAEEPVIELGFDLQALHIGPVPLQ